jgi:hypothetical protein
VLKEPDEFDEDRKQLATESLKNFNLYAAASFHTAIFMISW